MSYDFKEIFTSFTKDEHWIKKVAVVSSYYFGATLLFFLPFILFFASLKNHNDISAIAGFPICWLAAAILACAPNGYCFLAGHKKLQDPNATLPELKDFFKHSFIGFKFVIGWIILFFPVIVLGVITYIYYPEYFDKNTEYTATCLYIDIVTNLVSIILSCFLPVFLTMFIEKLNPLVFFNYKRAILMIKENFVPYLIFVGILFATNMLLSLSMLLVLVIVGLVIVPVIDVFFTLVCTETAVQFYQLKDRKAENLIESTEETTQEQQ